MDPKQFSIKRTRLKAKCALAYVMLWNSWTGSVIVPLVPSASLLSSLLHLFLSLCDPPPHIVIHASLSFSSFFYPPVPTHPHHCPWVFSSFSHYQASPSVYLPSALAAVRFGLFSLHPPPDSPSPLPLRSRICLRFRRRKSAPTSSSGSSFLPEFDSDPPPLLSLKSCSAKSKIISG